MSRVRLVSILIKAAILSLFAVGLVATAVVGNNERFSFSPAAARQGDRVGISATGVNTRPFGEPGWIVEFWLDEQCPTSDPCPVQSAYLTWARASSLGRITPLATDTCQGASPPPDNGNGCPFFRVPSFPAGEHRIRARYYDDGSCDVIDAPAPGPVDDTLVLVSHLSCGDTIDTVAPFHITAGNALSLDLSRTATEAGTTVGFSGEHVNYTPLCGPAQILFDGTQVATDDPVDTDGDGMAEISGTFVVPDLVPSTYLVEVRQDANGCNLVDRESFDITRLDTSRSSGQPGQRVVAHGEMFLDTGRCGEVRLTLGTAVVGLVDDIRDPSRTFDRAFDVPDIPPGDYTLVANQGSTCSVGNRIATEPFRVLAEEPTDEPFLLPNPAEGPIDSEFELMGFNWDDGVSVEITFADVELEPVPGSAVSAGQFTQPYLVPSSVPGGEQTIEACQRCGQSTELRATTTFVVTPRLFVEPSTGAPDSIALARGDGFPAQTRIRLAWSAGIGHSIVTSSETGTLVASIMVFDDGLRGPRELEAFLVDPPPLENGGEDEADLTIPIPIATAPFVATPGRQQPRDFTVRG